MYVHVNSLYSTCTMYMSSSPEWCVICTYVIIMYICMYTFVVFLWKCFQTRILCGDCETRTSLHHANQSLFQDSDLYRVVYFVTELNTASKHA